MTQKTTRRTAATAKREEAKAHFLRLVETGLTRVAAMAGAGRDIDSLYRWMDEDAEFADRVRAAEEKSRSSLEARVLSATTKDWRAAAWMLERRWPDAWGKVVKNENVNPNALPPTVNLNLPVEDLRDLVRALREDQSASNGS